MAKKKMGRPQFHVDWDLVDAWMASQCTAEEIAARIGCDADTLATACKRDHGQTFSERFEQKRNVGLGSLRSRQFRAAMEGDRTMLVWLGKNWLGQADKREIAITEVPPFEIADYGDGDDET